MRELKCWVTAISWYFQSGSRFSYLSKTTCRLFRSAASMPFSANADNMRTMAIICGEKISKCFQIYRRRSDQLKEFLSFGRKRYHEPFWAVKDVDITVDRGCCLGIIGENGSGKSTLLRLLAGVIRPTSGNISIGGRVCALLGLGARFNPKFTGRENIYSYALTLGITGAQTRER